MGRLLTGLSSGETGTCLNIFNTMMEKQGPHDIKISDVRKILTAMFGESLGEDGIEVIMQELPGWTKDIDDFIEEDDRIEKLEALDGEFLELSKARKWRWVKSDWDDKDLNIWNRLSYGPESWNHQKDGDWKTPVPQKSMPDLLYNSLRIVDGLSQPDKWGEGDNGNRTGLVLGNIQSGKTASMLGVSSVALDPVVGGGYKVLIVLGGHTENLRRQTQERFEIFKETEKLNVHFGTSSVEDIPNLEINNPKRRRDLKTRVDNVIPYLDAEKPIIWVVKKNTASLKGIIEIMNTIKERGYSPETLILDDESDHSSLNTKPNDDKGSTIHGLICKLRNNIEKNCYVGYTATPQGILMADPKSPLFPDDLLWLIEPHNKYIGADHFFNEMSHLMISTIQNDEWPNYGDESVELQLEEDRAAGRKAKLKQYQRIVLNEWKKEGAPESFKKALIDFVLTGGVRWRKSDFGEKELPYHSLMLHVEREIVGQQILGNVVDDAWEECKDVFLGLINTDFDFQDGNYYHELVKQRWERLLSNSEALRPDPKDRPQLKDMLEYFIQIIESVGEREHSGEHIRNGLRIINSEDGSELAYHLPRGDKDRPPNAMILIGGDLLSRGLTVEGLTVSYYLRLAKKPTYDTELQRCRWFGAKKGDEDVLTLWIQKPHQKMFKNLTDHNKDLVRQVRETVLRGLTPVESIIMLHVRDSYQVTGYSKRGTRVERLQDSYSGNTTQFKQPSIEFAKENMQTYHDFLDKLPRNRKFIFGDRGKLWENVDFNSVMKLLNNLKHETDKPKQIEPKELARYLQQWKDDQGEDDISEIPPINIVQRFGDKTSELSERGRELDGADGVRVPRPSFKNLAAGASGNFSGDWFLDAVHNKKPDMNMDLLEKWFHKKPEPPEGKERLGKGRRDWAGTRKEGAPILFVFYKLHPTYIAQKNPNGHGKWHLNELDHSHLIADEDLLGFICSLPEGGPAGGGIINRLIDRKNAKMIGGRVVDKDTTEEG